MQQTGFTDIVTVIQEAIVCAVILLSRKVQHQMKALILAFSMALKDSRVVGITECFKMDDMASKVMHVRERITHCGLKRLWVQLMV
ncbi:hypothetical protein BDR03DRAFT_1016683 [Suillus americanus]|nr:hypothetical protein BDR03DRAFT_1016683 [Suillus americanus]